MTGRSIMQLVGAPALTLSVWFAASWIPAQSGTEAARLQQAEDDRVQLIAELNEASLLDENLDLFEQRIATTESAIPPESQLGVFIADAGIAGNRAGVTIDQIAPLAVSGDDDVDDQLAELPVGTSSIVISIGAVGTYPGLLAFVDELTALDRLVLIDLVDLNVDDEISEQVILDLELRVFTTAVLTPEAEPDLEDFTDPTESEQ